MSAELIVTPSPSRTPILTTGEIIGVAVGGAVFVILVTTLLLIFSVWLVEIIDNHDSGYLGMAVQLYVQAHLGHYHILTQKEYSQKLMAQLKSTPHFTYICIVENTIQLHVKVHILF